MWESTRCVIFNASYEPLSIVSAKRAIILFFEGKAFIKETHPTYVVHSVSNAWNVPTELVLNNWVKARPTYRVPARLTPSNLWKRDKYTCQYCGRHRHDFKATEKLTRDHIHPTARGGKDVWENVVAACSTCNNKKADKFLIETHLKLMKRPFTPTLFQILSQSETKYIV